MTRDDRIGIIHRGRATGLTDVMLADLLRVSRQTIHDDAGPRPAGAPDPPTIDLSTSTAPADLPTLLRAWRTRHGWSQPDAAQELGVSTRTLNRWENERAACSFAGLVVRFIRLHDAIYG